MQEDVPAVARTNWRQVWVFVGLTFAVTYLLNLVLYLTVGYSEHPGTLMLLQVQMLLPAAVAIALQLLVFRNSPLYRLKGPARWFFYFYLVYTVIYLACALSVLAISNNVYQTVVSLLTLALGLVGLLVAILLRLVAGPQGFRRVGLAGGKVWHYLAFGLLFVVIYAVMTGLNALLGLGQSVDIRALLAQAAAGQETGLEQIPVPLLYLLIGVQNLVLAPFLGLLIAFGEEYGWRGYLQSELVKWGKVRGLLLLGVIWGLWHAPIIAMGHNYPGYPVAGILIMTFYTIGLAFLLGYAVFKSRSVWLAAYLHALNNSAASFLLVAVYTPNDPVFSFGAGLYGLLILAVVVAALLLFDRKAWAEPATAADVAIPIDLPAEHAASAGPGPGGQDSQTGGEM